MPERSNYQLLLAKLDEFRRKYYLNRLIRGGLFATAGVVTAYLAVSALEYYFYFPPAVRQVLFFGGLLAVTATLAGLVGLPLAKYFRVGHTIDDAEAARLIGAHFSEVEDRLLNVLQLRAQAGDASATDAALIEASIDQKITEIQPVPFSLAIDLGTNRRYLKYALPPLAVFLFLLFAAPNVLKESGGRLVRNGQHFERDAPFAFVLETDALEVVQYEDFPLDVKVEGQALPEAITLVRDGATYRMQKIAPDRFRYTFNKVAESSDFHLEAAGVRSVDYRLDVVPKPTLLGFDLQLDYPSYTGRKDEKLRNTGDVTAPVGTQVRWIFRTDHASELGLRFPDGAAKADRTGEGEFQFERRVMADESYRIGMANERVQGGDSVAYRLGAIPDQYPSIAVERFEDSTNNKFLYFLGEVGDDYGLRNLNFVWKWEGRDGLGDFQLKTEDTEPLPIARAARAPFSHSWNLEEKGLEPGDRITYYFEVWDNDGVHGSKSARTAAMTFEMPTLEEYEERTEANNDEIKDKLQGALTEIDEIQEEIDRLRDKLMQKKELDWEDRKNLEELLERQQSVQQQVESIRETFQENLQDQSDYKQYDESLMEKQQLLQQMFEEVLTDEMKAMFEEMEKLLEELSKEQSLEELEELEMTDDQLENELDRMLEMFKQFELEQKMQDITSKLEELAQDQEELAEETLGDDYEEPVDAEGEEGEESGEESDFESAEGEESETADSESDESDESDGADSPDGSEETDPGELAEKQDAINERFEQLQEDLREMMEMNSEMESPHDLDEMAEEQDQLSEDLEQTSDQLEQSEQSEQEGKSKKSQQQQQGAGQQMQQNSEQMQQMAQQMQQMMDQMMEEQAGEDMQALRQLLDNLIKLSFDQEKLMDEIAEVRIENPRYVELVQEQHKIREDAEMVEDSLLALAKRVFEISTFVTRELADINRNMDGGIEHLAERKVREARVNQQFVMTGMNNLALMLDEVLQQMQQQMANQMQGSQMCQKPGGNPKPGQGQQMKDLGNMQQQLNNQLQQLRDGQKPGQRNPLSAKQFAQMAARQAAIRQAMQQLSEQMHGTSEQGDIARQLKEIAEQMEGTEEDLVNKVFNNEMLMRQQEILTRLLEAEDAMRQREIDPQRKSNTADEISREFPPELAEYLKKRQAEIDLWKTVPADLKPYYRKLVEEYLEALP